MCKEESAWSYGVVVEQATLALAKFNLATWKHHHIHHLVAVKTNFNTFVQISEPEDDVNVIVSIPC